MAAHLGIHVIGPRYGESIVLELPDGGVGVIDSFAAWRVPHPVVGFLESRFPALDRLRFFGITHPHADHCFRAADILDRFPPEEVWVFRPFPAGQVQEYYRALQEHNTTDAVEAALALPVGSVADSLLQLHSRIRVPIRKKELLYRPFAGHLSFTMCGGGLRFNFLTPGPQSQYVYAGEVGSAAQAIFADGPALAAKGRLPKPHHNLTSGAVLIEYGNTRALLMSDAEGPRWDEWLDTPPPPDLSRPVHFIKASHHGSRNGYLQRSYAIFGDPKFTIAVMTPFNQGNKRLPEKSGVQAVRPHVKEVYCTNRAAAADSTGLTWNHPSPPPLPALPAQWVSMINQKRTLARLLLPAAGVSVTAGASPPLPPKWAIDAHAMPALWRLIRPQHRLPIPSPATVEPHTVSAYYDDRGNLLDLKIGDETGILVP